MANKVDGDEDHLQEPGSDTDKHQETIKGIVGGAPGDRGSAGKGDHGAQPRQKPDDDLSKAKHYFVNVNSER